MRLTAGAKVWRIEKFVTIMRPHAVKTWHKVQSIPIAAAQETAVSAFERRCRERIGDPPKGSVWFVEAQKRFMAEVDAVMKW